jgi:hypothetical protein
MGYAKIPSALIKFSLFLDGCNYEVDLLAHGKNSYGRKANEGYIHVYDFTTMKNCSIHVSLCS